MVFAHIRASTGGAIQQTNCHPFRHDSWLWMHNGLIRDFSSVKRDLVLAVDPALYPHIEGSTDSELWEVSEEARLIVSEPFGTLAGAWHEVAESSWVLVQPGHDEIGSFTPRPPAA